MSVLALIPARAGSRGIPNKNFKLLTGRTPLQRAVDIALACDCVPVVTTDLHLGDLPVVEMRNTHRLKRPPELAQDDTPMIDVIKHALAQIPGPPEQILVLLQPTQPLRTPAHVRAAIALLESSGADSVVSVVELPQTHAAINHAYITMDGDLMQCWGTLLAPTRRQDCGRTFIRDGTVYAFKRATVEKNGNIYGYTVRPLIIDPSETCALDTPADWADAERRLQA